MQSATATGDPAGTHRRVRINYGIRAGSFLYCFIVLALHGWERGLMGTFWVLLVLQFLVYPHLAWWRARSARHPERAEVINLYLDGGLLGAWIAALDFPAWIAYAALFSTSLNAMVVSGALGTLWTLACFGAGAALWVAGGGFRFSPATSQAVSALCFVGSLGYSWAVGWVVNRQSGRLAAARDELRSSEERYRLIAENAGDLIAMLDQGGHWLYNSPSYQRVLERDDLQPGVDAFRKMHPDDAESARVALLRASMTGKARDLDLRLVDRYGRFRQYKARLQVISTGELPASRLLLVSRDVTDLKESEERVLVAAHALEGMTEAIVITSAGGIIVSVNRAFCEITGFKRDDVLGQPEKAIRNALQSPEFYDNVFATVLREGYWSGSTWARRHNGSVYREWRSIRAVREADSGAVTRYVIVFYEVDEPRADDPLREGRPSGLKG
jgi:PAS domain S-box-containing protein